MKLLCYRSVLYSRLKKQISTIFSQKKGRYRGQPCNISMPVENRQLRSPKGVIVCKYRGVPYVVEYY